MIIVGLGWLLLSIAVGLFAQNYRNRDKVSWTGIAILTSPLIAFALVAAMQPAAPVTQPQRKQPLRQQLYFLAYLVAFPVVVCGGLYLAVATLEWLGY